jgi:SRSO17 transposase
MIASMGETKELEDAMQLPIVGVAPVVRSHAEIFRDIFANRCQFSHFQNYLTGLIVLKNKSLTNIARCVVDSADKTNLSRFFAEAPWYKEKINTRRIEYMLTATSPHRLAAKDSALIIDDTLCEHVGTLFEYVDHHYNHSDSSYPLAHNLVTSYYVSGAVRFPIEMRLYRRYEEVTQWTDFVRKHFPAETIPTQKKQRMAFHRRIDSQLLTDPAFCQLHNQFRTKIALAIELVEDAITRGIAFQWTLFDGWYLSPEFQAVLEKHGKDWISILKSNRNLETNSFFLYDAQKQKISFDGAHIKACDLVPLIPQNAYKPLSIGGRTYYVFTLCVHIPSIGKVRLVVSFDNPDLQGSYALLVSNRLDCTARQLITTYLQRWPIETFYQDSKQQLGLDEYRMRTAEAIKKHWCLVFVAYSFLHLECLSASLPQKCPSPQKSIGEAARQQAQALIQDLILYTHHALSNGQPIHDLISSLFSKQQPHVPKPVLCQV